MDSIHSTHLDIIFLDVKLFPSAVQLDDGTTEDYLHRLAAVFLLRQSSAGPTVAAHLEAPTAVNPTALGQFGHLLGSLVGEL